MLCAAVRSAATTASYLRFQVGWSGVRQQQQHNTLLIRQHLPRGKHGEAGERWGGYAKNGKQVQRQQLSQEKQHVRGCGLSSGCAVSAGSGLGDAMDGFWLGWSEFYVIHGVG